MKSSDKAPDSTAAELSQLGAEIEALQNEWQRERFSGVVLPIASQPGGDPRRFERKCHVALEIDWRSARVAELRLAEATAELTASEEATADAGDSLTLAVQKAITHRTAAEAALHAAEAEERRAKFALHQRAEEIKALRAAVERHRGDRDRWTKELELDQERLRSARERMALSGVTSD